MRAHWRFECGLLTLHCSRCVITWTVPPATLWDWASRCSRQWPSILSHCSWSCKSAWSWLEVVLAVWDCCSSPGGRVQIFRVSNISAKEICLQKARPLRLFKYFLEKESFICFKEVIAVVFDFQRKDILKPDKEIWNEFAVLHRSKCYSHWPSKEKHSVR